MPIDPDFWAGRRVLLTGHTGFKGAWTALWLQSLGARITGLAPAPPTEPSLYALADIGAHMDGELALDIRDARAVAAAIQATRPEVVLHLAAQPLVRRSLREPMMTFEVNVLGTINLLEAVRLADDCVRAVVVVTSDKCYANPAGSSRRFLESDPLGGNDPYSSSKACAELVTAAYRGSFFSADDAARVATARAGNVIGGGDFSEDRLVPDILRALVAGEPVRVRNPDAVRPWQHVLNPLSGYLTLAQALFESSDSTSPQDPAHTPDPTRASSVNAARAWNFGPRQNDTQTVLSIVQRLDALLDGGLAWELDIGLNPPEASCLELDSSAAESALGWHPRWDLSGALERVVQWHKAHMRDEEMRTVSLRQLADFVDLQGIF
jgi:CDP-glucose 4,6-dehydratase